MCETLIDRKLELFAHRRHAYETEAGFWKPDQTDEALAVFDFQDFLLAGIKYWDHLCRVRDALLAHDMECEKDHGRHFEAVSEAIQTFFNDATAAESLLSRVEQDYNVDRAIDFRSSLNEARLFCKTEDDLRGTRTPIEEWELTTI